MTPEQEKQIRKPYILIRPAGLGNKLDLFWKLIYAAFASLFGRSVLIELGKEEIP